ncbi:hypothetical protein [Natrialba sp. INN-245]|uniref:DUF7519 family protein n=1 Tax=Natrialba sp. INN-245 TaxID=2690967 RepID=UPI00130FAAF2|nr:hypothetical protein [Natrialba sp. INN-245]MWV40320.1 hypothetical protein [Natrialba sp. INN-245]
MSLAGPRLDRPSAIGDEGRPRAISLWIATLVIVAITVAIGAALGEPTLVTLPATFAGLAVAGIALLDRRGFVQLFVGHTLIVTFGSVFALLVLAAPLLGGPGIALAGFTVALFGIAMAWADVGGDGTKRAVASCFVTYAAVLSSSVFLLVVTAFGVLGWAIVVVVTETSSIGGSVVGFALVAVGAGCSALIALWVLPIRQLTPRSRRDRVESALSSARWRIGIGTIATFGVLIAVAIASVFDLLGPGVSGVPILESLLVGLSAPFVVWPIVGLALLALFASAVAITLRLLTRRFGTSAVRWSSAVVVGVSLVAFVVGMAIIVILGMTYFNLIGAAMAANAASIVVVILVVGPPAFLIVVGLVLVGVLLRIVPDRAGGPALAAVGLVVAAIGFGSISPILVFVCLAGAAVVWDVSTFGLGLTAELGHLPDTRRTELFHGVLSVGVGVVAVLVAVALEWVRTDVFGGVVAMGAVVAVGFGALILLLPLRG